MSVDTGKRLAGPIALANAAATVYTVPAATTTTVQNIHIANETAGAVTFSLSVGVDAAGKRVWYQKSIAANDAFDWSGFLILATPEVIQAYASAAASLTLTMSGIETA